MAFIAPAAVRTPTADFIGPDFITRLQAKDVRAFTSLYEKYSAALYALILRSTADKMLASDILQNAFLKIWLNLPMYDARKSGLYTWMMAITRNEIVDHYRAAGAKKRTAVKESTVEFNYGHEQNVSNKLDAKTVLKDLSSRHKVMFDLLYFKGYTFNETAILLNLPVGTVKTQVRTLLKKWRSTFDILYSQDTLSQ